MTEENKSKVRIRFAGGEEFEAEGSQDFIETQKNLFLALIGKRPEPNKVGHLQSPFQPNQMPPQEPTQKPDLKFHPPSTPDLPALRIWERLLKEDGDIVVLRQKFKITVQESAALILAGMRVLLKRGECSALELSRALKGSRITLENRLDRLLAGEIQQNRLISQGAKRSRTYKLTDGGFAKAFVLAEKLANMQN